MSHQTGIRANDALLKAFGKCKENKTRLIKVSILNEELSLTTIMDHKKDWQKDYDKMIGPLIQEDTPCYILYRLDEKNSMGYVWLLLTWVPESAPIRQKMLYASTKATLKTEFGSAYIKEEMHATTKSEITLDGYNSHKLVHSSPNPLTMREEEMRELRQTEVNTSIHTETRHPTLGGIQCPIAPVAVQALGDLKAGSYNYLQFRIDLQDEQIHLENAAQVEVAKLSKQVPADHARYHLFLFKHTHEGDYLESYVFIYSMPGYNCSVKERMMYSSCKAPFVSAIEELGIEITKKLEIDDASELTEDYLQNELHPKKILHRPAFAKPSGPPNRGARRITREQT